MEATCILLAAGFSKTISETPCTQRFVSTDHRRCTVQRVAWFLFPVPIRARCGHGLLPVPKRAAAITIIPRTHVSWARSSVVRNTFLPVSDQQHSRLPYYRVLPRARLKKTKKKIMSIRYRAQVVQPGDSRPLHDRNDSHPSHVFAHRRRASGRTTTRRSDDATEQ